MIVSEGSFCLKNIFIASPSMEIGGAERSLIGLLNALNYNDYNVELFLYKHVGEFMDFIPDQVDLLPPISRYTSLAVPILNVIKHKHYSIAIGRTAGKLMSSWYNQRNTRAESGVSLEYSHKYTKRYMPKIKPVMEYDLAISFITPHYIVAEKVKAKKKAAWVHSDYSNVFVDIVSEIKMWHNYDYIISVSEKSAESFCLKFPDLKAKIIVIENILSPQFVRQQAKQFTVDQEMASSHDTRKLLSVGRFGNAKNFDNIPEITKDIISSGYKVKWFIIGYGGGEALIKSKIIEYCMQEHVVILGKKVNPYPYFKACDIYVQPSRYEGKAVTVREAQMLCKPVVITDFPTAQSQLTDGFDGLIVPLDNKGCAEGIIKLISSRDLQNKLIKNCRKADYGNESEVEKIYRLID